MRVRCLPHLLRMFLRDQVIAIIYLLEGGIVVHVCCKKQYAGSIVVWVSHIYLHHTSLLSNCRFCFSHNCVGNAFLATDGEGFVHCVSSKVLGFSVICTLSLSLRLFWVGCPSSSFFELTDKWNGFLTLQCQAYGRGYSKFSVLHAIVSAFIISYKDDSHLLYRRKRIIESIGCWRIQIPLFLSSKANEFFCSCRLQIIDAIILILKITLRSTNFHLFGVCFWCCEPFRRSTLSSPCSFVEVINFAEHLCVLFTDWCNLYMRYFLS